MGEHEKSAPSTPKCLCDRDESIALKDMVELSQPSETKIEACNPQSTREIVFQVNQPALELILEFKTVEECKKITRTCNDLKLIFPRKMILEGGDIIRQVHRAVSILGSESKTLSQSSLPYRVKHPQETTTRIPSLAVLNKRCLEYEAREKELQQRVRGLENELQEVQREYAKLLIESQSLNSVKDES
eukprot:Gb_39864 [translate_table: standard]